VTPPSHALVSARVRADGDNRQLGSRRISDLEERGAILADAVRMVLADADRDPGIQLPSLTLAFLNFAFDQWQERPTDR
jgi:hypothetical protein